MNYFISDKESNCHDLEPKEEIASDQKTDNPDKVRTNETVPSTKEKEKAVCMKMA